ncbi:hypothetical protein DTO96_102507 [Ephemeroptericola cinctiostellae]|uniref:Uncharacterized protein n=1 Tax=Ephemeroptericola cinctiostellae TaxID=2268024 RepID=A0A345DEG3_9BURK|nr:hypothetical protein [Ephemeroptericola cinctiostellae]AXF86751.1 hypothetical protein DTO96_102507 [Ephemeroptericola cinctiostellae]
MTVKKTLTDEQLARAKRAQRDFKHYFGESTLIKDLVDARMITGWRDVTVTSNDAKDNPQ